MRRRLRHLATTAAIDSVVRVGRRVDDVHAAAAENAALEAVLEQRVVELEGLVAEVAQRRLEAHRRRRAAAAGS